MNRKKPSYVSITTIAAGKKPPKKGDKMAKMDAIERALKRSGMGYPVGSK